MASSDEDFEAPIDQINSYGVLPFQYEPIVQHVGRFILKYLIKKGNKTKRKNIQFLSSVFS